MKKIIFVSVLTFLAAWLAVSFGPEDRHELIALAAAPAPDVASVARGGLLYDKWWKVVPGATKPKGDQALWSQQTNNKRKGSGTWRCKECHGWDYKGKDGAYSKGSHRTGFPGVWDAAQKKSVKGLAAILRGSSNSKHDFSSVMRPQDIADLANFLKHGLIDVTQYVNYKTKKPVGGNASQGKALSVMCTACHGPDGKKLNFGSEKKPQYVGTVAKKNPQEYLHKVRMGQPGSAPAMPAALAMGWSMKQVVDNLAYAQTLPVK